MLQADVDQPGQECSRGKHNRTSPEAKSYLGHNASDPVTFKEDVVHRLLEQRQIRLALETAADSLPVKQPIRLRARRPDRRPLGRVERTELDPRLVCRQGHRAPKRIHFLYQVAFSDPANGGVARHLPQCLDTVGEQQGLAAEPGGSKRSLGAGMAAANHDYVEFSGELHGGWSCAANDT